MLTWHQYTRDQSGLSGRPYKHGAPEIPTFGPDLMHSGPGLGTLQVVEASACPGRPEWSRPSESKGEL